MPMGDQRNYWDKGIVRHLRLDPDTPLDSVYALRLDHDGGLSAGGTTDIYYTLAIHPKHKERIEEYREMLERSSSIGGPFSPVRDL